MELSSDVVETYGQKLCFERIDDLMFLCICLECQADLVGFWQNGVGSGRILAVVVVVVGLGFGLPVLLFDELGLVEGIVGELHDIRNVVVLSYVYSTHRPYYERKATLYDTHHPKILKTWAELNGCYSVVK
ncbi:hypothetical protein SO802_005041 [Lithocarpus litseifolius]|uniref:Uncharacterized protein n=1 Tax=Lithocarpus litseifolius TaxID=425828 RepID=A0AAW2DH17_9ROSI